MHSLLPAVPACNPAASCHAPVPCQIREILPVLHPLQLWSGRACSFLSYTNRGGWLLSTWHATAHCARVQVGRLDIFELILETESTS